MRRHQAQTRRKREQGVIITLVAVFMASVVIVMAALAIDLTTLYTARSEAQLAADAAALAAARVLANSGMTSSTGATPPFDIDTAKTNARTVATQLASSNPIGGKNLSSDGSCNAAQISVCFNDGDPFFISNPHVTVQVSRTDLPTFFLRFWSKQLTVTASATAEAYNPSGTGGDPTPVAPLCVKPWLLPNIDPTQANASGPAIFDRTTGAIVQPNLVGRSWPSANPSGLRSRLFTSTPQPGRYYAGTVGSGPADFPEPTQALPGCSAGFTRYQLAVAGCVPRPIPCGATETINIDTAPYASKTGTRNSDTLEAVECLIHYKDAGDTDSINGAPSPTVPFEFVAGSQNPIASAAGKHVLVSDSLVTIPVYDSGPAPPPPTSPVTVIGFLQVFLNPQAGLMPSPTNPVPTTQIPVTIINMVGCGTSASGTPVYGNGPSAIPVRLISPP